MIEIKAKLNNLRLSAKKVGLVAGAIRGSDVVTALQRLPVIFKRSAPIVEKLLRSAVANAKDRYDVKEEDLLIKSIMVNKAADLKRWRPAAFGSAHPFRKRSSHIEIVLTVKEGAKAVARDKVKIPVETLDLTKPSKKSTAAKNSVKKDETVAKVKDKIKVKKD
jgi:large subunit ribosomal protein L22